MPTVLVIAIVVMKVYIILTGDLAEGLVGPVRALTNGLRRTSIVRGGARCGRLIPFVGTVEVRRRNILTTTGDERSFATGISRRLGAPLATVSNCTRLVRGNVIRGRRRVRFTARVEEGTRHLLSLVGSVVGLSRLSSDRTRRNFRRLSLCNLIGSYVRGLRIGTRREGMTLGFSNASYVMQNGERLLARLIRGLYRGTVHCGGRNNAMGIAMRGLNNGAILAIRSGNVNVPGSRRRHIFRHFCEISGDHSGRANNANLKLTVMGRVIRLRSTKLALSDRIKHNAAVGIRF